MIEYVISFALAFIISISATPIAKKVAYKIGAVDIPRDNRRIHKKPIARLGGLAIISGFFVSVLFNVTSTLYGMTSPVSFDSRFTGLVIGSLIIIAVGIIDDVKKLNAKVKFLFQVVAALVAAYSGTRIEIVTNPFSGFEVFQFNNPYVSYILTVLWIVGITNAINLIDGLDGLAAGVSSISSLSLFFVSVIFKRWDTAILTATLAGATLGFLPYNFNPAKIFVGDTGAYFLGYVLSVISIQGTLKSYTAIAIAIPMLILGLPLFDTIFAIIRRLASGKSIMEADRGHLHHRLMDMGLTQRQSVLILYIASSALGLCAIVLADKGAMSAVILIIAVAAFVIGGARYMNEININEPSGDNSRVQDKQPEQGRDSEDKADGEEKQVEDSSNSPPEIVLKNPDNAKS